MRSPSLATVGTLALACLLVATGVAIAGDDPTVVYADEETVGAAPGETAEVVVLLASDGATDDDGVASVTFVASYDPTHVTAVEPDVGEWLARGEETDVETTVEVDDEDGIVTIEQWRDPPAGGATGFDRFATLAFAVDEDAPDTNITVDFEETDVVFTGDVPAPVFAHDATIEVRGNGGVAGDGDEIDVGRIAPGFSLWAALGGLVALALVLAVARRSR